MEFLLNISISFTRDEDEQTRARLIAAEHEAVQALSSQGHLVRIWRTPGAFGNWAVWQAQDATELHDIISGLPLFPWDDRRRPPPRQAPARPGRDPVIGSERGARLTSFTVNGSPVPRTHPITTETAPLLEEPPGAPRSRRSSTKTARCRLSSAGCCWRSTTGW